MSIDTLRGLGVKPGRIVLPQSVLEDLSEKYELRHRLVSTPLAFGAITEYQPPDYEVRARFIYEFHIHDPGCQVMRGGGGYYCCRSGQVAATVGADKRCALCDPQPRAERGAVERALTLLSTVLSTVLTVLTALLWARTLGHLLGLL